MAESVKCKKCGETEALVCHGKKYALYPAGCLVIFGFLWGTLHQASAPVMYECKTCGARFGVRSVLAKLALVVLIIMMLFVVVVVLKVLRIWA